MATREIMSKKLEDLSEKMRPLAVELIKQSIAAGIPVRVIDTLRTIDEQAENVKRGVSWTLNSRHLPDKDGKSNAIDLAPTEVLSLKNWAPAHPSWEIIGRIGENLGLVWGGRWARHKDNCHFEFPLLYIPSAF